MLRAFRSYQKRLAGARERSLSTGAELPDEPSVVSYLVAAAAVLDIPAKQRLLQAPDTATRLREELKLLRAETAVIRHLPSLPAVGADPRRRRAPTDAEEALQWRRSTKKQHAGGTPATVALTAAGAEFTMHAYEHDPAAPRTARRRRRRWGSRPTGCSRRWSPRSTAS